MPYRESYGSQEKSLAEAIADELLIRGIGLGSESANDTLATNQLAGIELLGDVCDRLDTLIQLLSSGLINGKFQTNDNTVSRYIVQQNELALTWIISSPIEYPDVTVYVTQIGSQILSAPLSLETADWRPSSSHEITVHFDNEPCKGFVVLH